MEALEAIMTRRSNRKYLDRPVEKEKLEKILEAGRAAPCGGNNRYNHFLVIRDKDIREKLVRLSEEAFRAMEVHEDTYPSLKTSILLSKRGGYVFSYHAPVIVIVANRKGYGNNRFDAAAAMENMLIAANALDLGGCWVNQIYWLNEYGPMKEYLEELGLKKNERAYGTVLLGYASSADGLPRRSLPSPKGNEVTWH